MKTLTLLLILAGGCPGAGLSGKWDVIAQSGTGPELKMELTLSEAAGALAGTLANPAGSVPLQEVKLSGSDLSFKFAIGPTPFEVKVTVAGDTMSGTFSSPQGMSGKFTAKRAALPDVKAEAGEIAGSGYLIDMPTNYNGSLVVYCHGYGGNVKFDTSPNSMLKVFTDAGYAVAQAGYSGGGWAVEQALTDTEALRKFFIGKYGKPKRTFVTGHSMGGLITLALIEKFPEGYDGAMPMCGPLAPTLSTFQRHLFDLLVVFDYYYPGAIVRLHADYAKELAKVVDADPRKRAAVAKYAGFQAPEQETAMGIAFFANILKELGQRAGGNAFDNRDTIYYGGEDDLQLNRGVKRYAADPKAVEYVKRYYTSTGKLTRPVLAVHSFYDPVVPTWATDEYGDLVRRGGTSDFFVQRFTAHGGHCAIKPQETIHAFTDLVEWVASGRKPAAGEQK
ncbi:MAG: alpha/beta fold hydrolase [Acidobacteria bacterium]|nr:alpha/beta fold hydrolase [Acidobacteriota bacterium]